MSGNLQGLIPFALTIVGTILFQQVRRASSFVPAITRHATFGAGK